MSGNGSGTVQAFAPSGGQPIRTLQLFDPLTGRIRQKVDDEIPELFQSLMALLWPHYLRPVPSTTILQFMPMVEQLSGVAQIPRNTEIESVAVDGTACRFRTCYPVELAPLDVENATLDLPMATDAQLRITLKAVGKVPLPNMKLARVPRPFSLHTSRHLMRLLGKSDDQWRKYLFF